MASPTLLPVIPPPPSTDIMDGSGNKLGALPISTQDLAQLAATGKIILQFHTPRMLRETLGPRHFTLTLTQDITGKVNTADPTTLAQAVSHLAEIASSPVLKPVLTTSPPLGSGTT